LAQITQLLAGLHANGARGRDQLFASTYEELRRLAHARLHRGGRSSVLDTCALVHEAYLRIVKSPALAARDRRAYFAYASRVMRSVIVDSVRERRSRRRGGGAVAVTLAADHVEVNRADDATILRVHEALDVLAQADARLAEIVEMRYFGGFSEREIAHALGLGERTVQRHWDKARRILVAALA
jgi:RNA polymerase sigma factor (TIGR02999 family)